MRDVPCPWAKRNRGTGGSGGEGGEGVRIGRRAARNLSAMTAEPAAW